jgi:hypothetical protein
LRGSPIPTLVLGGLEGVSRVELLWDYALLLDDTVETLIDETLPLATLITPNGSEAELKYLNPQWGERRGDDRACSSSGLVATFIMRARNTGMGGRFGC